MDTRERPSALKITKDQGKNGSPVSVTSKAISEPVPDQNHCKENVHSYLTYDQFDPTDSTKNAKHYDKYAQLYDGMHDKAGFNDPYWLAKVAADKLGQPGQSLSLPNSRLIDFGCGTGRLGVELKKVGYTNISGVDGSSEMITVAH